MEPIEEVLEIVRAIRESQLEARQTQVQAMARQRNFLLFGGLFFVVIILGYSIWAYFLLAHSK